MSYDFDPESGPDADSFNVIDIGQFSSKKEAEDNWRDILSKDQWAYQCLEHPQMQLLNWQEIYLLIYTMLTGKSPMPLDKKELPIC